MLVLWCESLKDSEESQKARRTLVWLSINDRLSEINPFQWNGNIDLLIRFEPYYLISPSLLRASLVLLRAALNLAEGLAAVCGINISPLALTLKCQTCSRACVCTQAPKYVCIIYRNTLVLC